MRLARPLPRFVTAAVALALSTTTVAATATAAPLVPADDFAALHDQMARHERQFYLLSAYPFGLSLDVHPKDEAGVALIDQFLAQDENDDFQAVTGQHLFETLSHFGEYGDLGFFGGVALAGTTFRYRTMKRDGAPEEVLAEARARVVRAADAWHVFYVVTGGGGLVARGIRRIEPADPADPPLPLLDREIVPLFDEDGAPLPQPKDNGTYRADNSGGVLPEGEWTWSDSCSKDQMVGQVFGMVNLYDAIKDDPDVDQALVTRLQEDARKVGEMLMEQRDIGPLEGPAGAGLYDLIIMDADGRPTFHHDLNPLSLEKVYLPHGAPTYNLFNLIMGWAVVKGLHHVSGDPRLEAFLYEELLGARDYLGKLAAWREPAAFDYIYAGTMTNTDNPDMTSIALWLAIHLENAPEVLAVLHEFLENGWWDRADESRTARVSKQPLWHAVYLALTERATDDGALRDELVDLLLGFELGPYWNPARVNCDEDEIAARECLAVDGETVLHLEAQDDRGRWMATEALHPRIRPPSNFDARSDPFRVNGGGGLRLNPGGDLLASYWIARFLPAHGAGAGYRSPNARDHMPVGGVPVDPPDAGADVADTPDTATAPDTTTDTATAPDTAPVPDTAPDTAPDAAPDAAADTAPAPDGGGGGGCAAAPTAPPSTAFAALLLLLAALALARRRGAVRG